MEQNSRRNDIPQHIAIIMDGNGRWAKHQGQERLYGHQYGVESVRSVVTTAAEIGVRYLTIYAFSTENWGRPTSEVDGIMELLAQTIVRETEELASNGIQLQFIGDLATLPKNLQKSIESAQNHRPESLRLTLLVALNYSARWEITEACRRIAEKVSAGELSPAEITQQHISDHLTTAGIPDPELLIRTSGEQRLSNFLLWQLSYTELYFTPVLWPDFDGQQLRKAVETYNSRERRFGRVEAC